MRAAVLLCVLLSACTAVGPDYHAPEVAAPKQWTGAKTKPATPLADKWWEDFHDPLLNTLINEAIAANLDLKQALLRIQNVRILRSATIAAGLPVLSGKSTLSRRFNNAAAAGGGAGVGTPQVIHIFQAGFDAQWELDFFGGTQRAVEAANASIEAEIENSRAVLVTLVGDVVRNFIELRRNQQLLQSTKDQLANQRDTLGLAQVRQQAGLSNELDIAQAQAACANLQAQLPNYHTAIKQAGYALSVLLGRDPAALTARLAEPQAVPRLQHAPITDLPSRLLQRRPDIRYAERQLAVANAQVGIATAALYPSINLAAFLGLQNMRITDFTPMSKSWSTASSLSIPLFNWGKLNADIASKKTEYQAQVLAYQASVLSAFKDVEDALIAYKQEQQRYAALEQSQTAQQLTLTLANERYQKGLTAFLDVLTAQQAVQQARSESISSQAQLANNAVALYKALGGGWQTQARVDDNCTAYKTENKLQQVASLLKDCAMK